MHRLNLDVWQEIIAFLFDPRDVLCLRMTSSSLHQMTLRRSVWIRALRTLCLMRGAPLCSFSFETLTASQAERYTLRPYRFFANVLSPTPNLLRHVELVDRTRKDVLGAWEDELRAVIWGIWVVPGGRFAITINEQYWMSVWDLGDAANEDAQPLLVTSVSLGGYPPPGYLEIVPLDAQSKIRVVVEFRPSPIEEEVKWRHQAEFIDIDLSIRDGRRSGEIVLEKIFSRPPRSAWVTWFDLGSVPYLQRLSLAPRAHYAFEIDFKKHQIGVRDLVRDLVGIIEIVGSPTQAFETPSLPASERADQVEFVADRDPGSNRVLVHMLAKRCAEVIVFSYDVSLFVSLGDAQKSRTQGAYNVTRLDMSWSDSDTERHILSVIRDSTHHLMIQDSDEGDDDEDDEEFSSGVIHFPSLPVSTLDSSSSSETAVARPFPPFVAMGNVPRMHMPMMTVRHLLAFDFNPSSEKVEIVVLRLDETGRSVVHRSYRVDAPIEGWHEDVNIAASPLDTWRGAMYFLTDWSDEDHRVRVFDFTEAV